VWILDAGTRTPWPSFEAAAAAVEDDDDIVRRVDVAMSMAVTVVVIDGRCRDMIRART
jgi:hypothetical protein